MNQEIGWRRFYRAAAGQPLVGCNNGEGGEASGSLASGMESTPQAGRTLPGIGSIKLTVEKGNPHRGGIRPAPGRLPFQETMKQELLEARARSGDTQPLPPPCRYTAPAPIPSGLRSRRRTTLNTLSSHRHRGHPHSGGV